jgi:hypothetical protein
MCVYSSCRWGCVWHCRCSGRVQQVEEGGDVMVDLLVCAHVKSAGRVYGLLGLSSSAISGPDGSSLLPVW